MIWGCLESWQHLEAARRLLRAQQVRQRMEAGVGAGAANGGENARALGEAVHARAAAFCGAPWLKLCSFAAALFWGAGAPAAARRQLPP